MNAQSIFILNFDCAGIALLAALALCLPALAAAQNTTLVGPLLSVSAPAQTGTATLPNRWTPRQLRAAFEKTDANGDGKLSREELSVWAGLSRRFDQIDTDKDGSVSSVEFEEALK